MIGFLVRKTLYDLWDNFFSLILLNLLFAALCAAALFTLPALEKAPLAWWPAALAFLFILAWYLTAVSLMVKPVPDYGMIRFASLIPSLKRSVRPACVLAAFAAALILVVMVAFPFYLGLQTPLGLAMAGLLFWSLVITALALQFFLAGMNRLDTKCRKTFKKCFIILADNTGFSLFCMLAGLILSALLVTFPVGLILFTDEALRLRLLKYDWLEAHPDAPHRARIPWDTLLSSDRETTGTRSWRDFVFPWKG